MTDLHVSWDEYNRLVERLALIVHDSGWQFDAIICLARGGLRVGDALSRIFDKPLGVMTTSSYRASGGTQQGHLKIGDQVSSAEDVTHGRILLADDLVDTGVTLLQVLPELRARHRGDQRNPHGGAVVQGCFGLPARLLCELPGGQPVDPPAVRGL